MPTHGKLLADRCTRLMYRGKQLFINGEVACVQATAALRHLADARELSCDHALARKLNESELRSEEHTSELQSLMRISYAVFCLKKKNSTNHSPMTSYKISLKQTTQMFQDNR